MRDQPQFKAYAALAAVCLVWGTTYLGIRMALESFPPLLLICLRYTISGALLIAAAGLYGAHIPRGRELARTAATGILLLGVGNGCLVFAEQWVPSGMAALFVTTSPFWMVGIEAAAPRGERLHAPTIAGMLVGLLGVALLVTPAGWSAGLHGQLAGGFLLLQLGCAGWAAGSITQRRHATQTHPVVAGAVQQLVTGLLYLPLWLLFSGPSGAWKTRSVLAVLYLALSGSIIGYSAYLYALHRLPVAVVSLYTYVNPTVAVLLGWLFYREPFGARAAAAMAIIFCGVAVVKRFGHSGGESHPRQAGASSGA
ncbi:MAG: EamA family transporter [Bryobacteraceae bacterium]